MDNQPIDETAYYTQLTQVRVPLEHAADAFAQRAASGSMPIVVVPERPFRLRLDVVGLGVAAIVGGIIAANIGMGAGWVSLLVIAGLLLILIAIYRVMRTFIPEGVQALLARGGRYTHTIGSGPHFILPWIAISHLVTRREIPFEVVVVDALTQNNVRARLETLFTFTISEPYHFVYNISADDFDRVFQATCQDSLRSLVRQITSDQVHDLVRQDLSELRQALSAEAEPYGITIMRIKITSAQPPDDFMRSQEARQLAIIQQAEQAEHQALALRRQRDQADLAQQEVIARVEREREELKLQLQQVEMRQRVIELEAKIEEFRLAKLEERLHNNPLAARWEWQGDQLAVARALASNTRAIVQLGNTDTLVRTILARDFNGSAVDPQTFTGLIHEDEIQLEHNE